jgi:hypothetical protein
VRKLIVLLAMLGLFGVQAEAQDELVWEGFGAFSILSLGGEDDSDFDFDREQLFGWQASVAANATPMLGLVADFGGQYRSIDIEGDDDFNIHSYQYLFGPRLNFRGERGGGFVHALFGGFSAGNEIDTDHGFGMGIGLGLDVNVNPNFGIRVLQLDWLPNNVGDDWNSDVLRFGFGVVFKGGGA